MNAFLTALQFLTRIHLVNREFSLEDFGRGTQYFSLVGAVLGAIYACAAFLLLHLFQWLGNNSATLMATFLLLLPILCTGGLMLDGLMDTFDGIASGRSRERMLEIMKDSRVGSFGVLALIAMLLLQWSFLHEIKPEMLLAAVFVTPVIGRFGMVIAVSGFPYARKQGMGKIFAEMATKKMAAFALLVTLLCVVPVGKIAIVAFFVGSIVAYLWARNLSRILGGLTGDTYGAVETVTETVVLCVFALASLGAW